MREKETYEAPRVLVEELKSEGIICSSLEQPTGGEWS